MDPLARYLDLIVEPTYEEFRQHPTSLRHAYLACVATYHAVDRAKGRPAALRQKWSKESLAFEVIDHVAHDFKHVKSNQRNRPLLRNGRPALPLAHAIYGAFDPEAMNETGHVASLRNVVFLVRDAIRFLRTKVAEL